MKAARQMSQRIPVAGFLSKAGLGRLITRPCASSGLSPARGKFKDQLKGQARLAVDREAGFARAHHRTRDARSYTVCLLHGSRLRLEQVFDLEGVK
jgi:hypothetical protein